MQARAVVHENDYLRPLATVTTEIFCLPMLVALSLLSVLMVPAVSDI